MAEREVLSGEELEDTLFVIDEMDLETAREVCEDEGLPPPPGATLVQLQAVLRRELCGIEPEREPEPKPEPEPEQTEPEPEPQPQPEQPQPEPEPEPEPEPQPVQQPASFQRGAHVREGGALGVVLKQHDTMPMVQVDFSASDGLQFKWVEAARLVRVDRRDVQARATPPEAGPQLRDSPRQMMEPRPPTAIGLVVAALKAAAALDARLRAGETAVRGETLAKYQEGLELIELALASHAGNAKVQAGLGSKAADVRNRLQALVDASEPEPEPRPGLGEDAATPRPQAVKLAVDVLKHAARTHDLVARGDVGRRGEALRLFCEGAALLTEAAAAPGMSEPLRAALEEKLSDVNSIIERYRAAQPPEPPPPPPPGGDEDDPFAAMEAAMLAEPPSPRIPEDVPPLRAGMGSLQQRLLDSAPSLECALCGEVSGNAGEGIRCTGSRSSHFFCQACVCFAVESECAGPSGRYEREISSGGAVSPSGQLPCPMFPSCDCGNLPVGRIMALIAEHDGARTSYMGAGNRLAVRAAEQERERLERAKEAAEAEESDLDKLHGKVLKALAEGATVACPRCGTHTEKNDACMHMTCACGASFCYCCGRPSSRGGVPIDPPPRDGRGGSLCPRNPGGGEVGCDAIACYLEANPGWDAFHLPAGRKGVGEPPETKGEGARNEFHRRRMAFFLRCVREKTAPELWGQLVAAYPELLENTPTVGRRIRWDSIENAEMPLFGNTRVHDLPPSFLFEGEALQAQVSAAPAALFSYPMLPAGAPDEPAVGLMSRTEALRLLRAGAKFLLCDPGGLPRHDRWCWTEDTSGSVITRGDVRISWAKKLKGKKSKTLTLLEYHPLGMHTFGQVCDVIRSKLSKGKLQLSSEEIGRRLIVLHGVREDSDRVIADRAHPHRLVLVAPNPETRDAWIDAIVALQRREPALAMMPPPRQPRRHDDPGRVAAARLPDPRLGLGGLMAGGLLMGGGMMGGGMMHMPGPPPAEPWQRALVDAAWEQEPPDPEPDAPPGAVPQRARGSFAGAEDEVTQALASEEEEDVDDLMGDQSWARTEDFSAGMDDLFADMMGGLSVEELREELAASGADVNATVGAMGDDERQEAAARRAAEAEAAREAAAAEEERQRRIEKRRSMSKEEKVAKMKCGPLQKKATALAEEGSLVDVGWYDEAMRLLRAEEWVQAEAALRDVLAMNAPPELGAVGGGGGGGGSAGGAAGGGGGAAGENHGLI